MTKPPPNENGTSNNDTSRGPDKPFKIGISGPAPDDPPFVGRLAFELQKKILETADGWRAEGEKIDLNHSIVILEASGAALPDDMVSSGVCVGAKGSVGTSLEVHELLEILSELVARTAQNTNHTDPFTMNESMIAAATGFVVEAQKVKDRFDDGGVFQRIRRALPSRKREAALILAVNRYLRVLSHIRETGSIEVPPDEPNVDGAGLGSLTREDFDRKK